MMISKITYLVKRALRQELAFSLAMPAVIWQLTFLLVPALLLFCRSFLLKDGFALTLIYYKECFNILYFTAIGNSLVLAYQTAFGCLLFCLPLAVFIRFRVPKEFRTTLLFLLMMPSWTNFIIRIYSWFFLLRNNGLLFKVLKALSLVNPNGSLLANSFATQVVMVYCYFQFMLLPIYDAINNVDPRLLEASSDLGASNLQTFWRVIFPMILKGILVGFLIVLLAAYGEFAIPEFIGGAKKAFWGNMVVGKFTLLNDYSSGSALIFFGVACLSFSIFISFSLLKLSLNLINKFISLPKSLTTLQILWGGKTDE